MYYKCNSKSNMLALDSFLRYVLSRCSETFFNSASKAPTPRLKAHPKPLMKLYKAQGFKVGFYGTCR